VQLSRCLSLDGIVSLSGAREPDIAGNNVPESNIAGNSVPESMGVAEQRLERLSEATIKDAETWDWVDWV
jgi:hypothetical protein